MLAKLRMSVEEATEAFCTIADEAYREADMAPLERSQRLHQCRKNIMKKRNLPVDMKLLDERQTEDSVW